jgi:hypothetical protein
MRSITAGRHICAFTIPARMCKYRAGFHNPSFIGTLRPINITGRTPFEFEK